MRISQLILTHINIVRHYVTMISILYKMGEKKGVILHITVVVATILIFYDDKNIDSK